MPDLKAGKTARQLAAGLVQALNNIEQFIKQRFQLKLLRRLLHVLAGRTKSNI